MSKRYLIVIEAPYLAAGAALRAVTRSSVQGGPTNEIYADRRNALVSIAQALLPTGTLAAPPPPNAAVQALTDLPSAIASAMGPPIAAAPPPGVTVLEGIGALVVDDSRFDPKQLSGLVGVEVFEDQDIELPPPIASTQGIALATPWHLAHIAAHGAIPATGQDILVGVLDTGIEATHPEFVGKPLSFGEYNPLGVQISTVPRDLGTHGTHVCSLIAGATCGVAPSASLAVAAVLTTPTANGSMSGTLVQIANGLNWLLTHTFPGRQSPGVDILNASLGGSGYNGYLRAALSGALALPGVLLVASIGNSGRGGIGLHGSPGNYPEVLGVGAVDATSTVASFSDWGSSAVPPPAPAVVSKPDLSAPGVNVLGAHPSGGFVLSSGTSMASPLVCGLGAAMLQVNPALLGNPAQLRTDLLARAAAHPVIPHHAGNTGGIGEI